ncbi:MAG: hypothetical protein NTV88_05135 [Candidatus Micrarchaeota archaeon]|nr:hypothetical protein [Candidatus Micrarchaeota archaeon]
MPTPDFNIAPVDEAFRTLSKILFGRDVGSLKDFSPYLKEAMMPYTIEPSCISGGQVYMSNNLYPKGGKFVGPGEPFSCRGRKHGLLRQ